MEDILKKREQKLIKEGLDFIDYFEEYTSKKNPDIYKKYLDLMEEKFINSSFKWRVHMQVLYDIKKDLKTLEFDDMIKEMENYIKTYKPKVLLDREDLNKINDNVNIINKISKITVESRLNYVLKCLTFFKYKRKNDKNIVI